MMQKNRQIPAYSLYIPFRIIWWFLKEPFLHKKTCALLQSVLNVFKLMAALEHHLVQHLDGR